MKMSSVLVEYEDRNETKTYANSGVMFGDKYVIVTANVLMTQLQTDNIYTKLLSLPEGLQSPEKLLQNKLKLNVVSQSCSNKTEYREACVAAVFSCKNIRMSCQKVLRDWTFDVEEIQAQLKELLSLFFILEINDNTNFDMENLKASFRALMKEIDDDVHIGKDVYIKSTPFGNRHFLNSYSRGIVSNVIGERSCFILTDCPTAPGSEGALMFSVMNKKPVGIVISSISWWKGEWIGLTVVAKLMPLIQGLISSDNGFITSQFITTAYNNLYRKVSKSVAQLVCGLNWGSCILIDKKELIFITNTHVVEDFDECMVYWNDIKTEANVLFRTPTCSSFDLAIVQCKSNDSMGSKMLPSIMSIEEPIIGEEIYAIGYPLFSKSLQPLPTLTKGHVAQAHNGMLKTTCTVLAGSSGGGIVRANGDLIGIIVSNTKLQDTAVIYPRFNMAVPISAIRRTLIQFLETKDVKTLDELCSSSPAIRKEWNLGNSKL